MINCYDRSYKYKYGYNGGNESEHQDEYWYKGGYEQEYKDNYGYMAVMMMTKSVNSKVIFVYILVKKYH